MPQRSSLLPHRVAAVSSHTECAILFRLGGADSVPPRSKTYGMTTRCSNDGVDGPLAASTCQTGVLKNHQEWEPSMSEITTIGLDVAKHVFQVHGIDAQGATVLRKRQIG